MRLLRSASEWLQTLQRARRRRSSRRRDCVLSLEELEARTTPTAPASALPMAFTMPGSVANKDVFAGIFGTLNSPYTPVNPVSIATSGATETGTTVTITTNTAHGLFVGQTVTIAGVGLAGYNGTFPVTATPSPTTFTYTAAQGLTSSGGGTSLGGQIPTGTVVYLAQTGSTLASTDFAVPMSGANLPLLNLFPTTGSFAASSTQTVNISIPAADITSGTVVFSVGSPMALPVSGTSIPTPTASTNPTDVFGLFEWVYNANEVDIDISQVDQVGLPFTANVTPSTNKLAISSVVVPASSTQEITINTTAANNLHVSDTVSISGFTKALDGTTDLSFLNGTYVLDQAPAGASFTIPVLPSALLPALNTTYTPIAGSTPTVSGFLLNAPAQDGIGMSQERDATFSGYTVFIQGLQAKDQVFLETAPNYAGAPFATNTRITAPFDIVGKLEQNPPTYVSGIGALPVQLLSSGGSGIPAGSLSYTITALGPTGGESMQSASQSVTTGAVTGLPNLVPGSGFTPSSNGTLTFSGGGGSGAAGTFTTNASGAVASVSLTSGGSGYTSSPTVGFSGAGAGTATVQATIQGPQDAVLVWNPYPYATGYNIYRTVGGVTSKVNSAIIPNATASTTLSAGFTPSSTAYTIAVNSTAGFPKAGGLVVTDSTGANPPLYVTYSGKTDTSFTGVHGTFSGTQPTISSASVTALPSFIDQGSYATTLTPPSNNYNYDPLNKYYDQALQDFFEYYRTNDFVLDSTATSTTWKGRVVDLPVNGHTYTVLQLTGEAFGQNGNQFAGKTANIYLPFYSTNTDNSSLPPAPYWQSPAIESPTSQVFGNDGAFGLPDNTITQTTAATDTANSRLPVKSIASFPSAGGTLTAGIITGLNINAAGTGFTPNSNGTLTFTGAGTGASGTFTTNAGGGIATVNLTNGGSGYTYPPTIGFAGIATVGTGASVQPTMSSSFPYTGTTVTSGQAYFTGVTQVVPAGATVSLVMANASTAPYLTVKDVMNPIATAFSRGLTPHKGSGGVFDNIIPPSYWGTNPTPLVANAVHTASGTLTSGTTYYYAITGVNINAADTVAGETVISPLAKVTLSGNQNSATLLFPSVNAPATGTIKSSTNSTIVLDGTSISGSFNGLNPTHATNILVAGGSGYAYSSFGYKNQLVGAVLNNAGTGYQVNDVLTINGNFITPAQVTVDTVSGGAIATFHISNGGEILNPPGIASFPVGVTGGNGSGATFTFGYQQTDPDPVIVLPTLAAGVYPSSGMVYQIGGPTVTSYNIYRGTAPNDLKLIGNVLNGSPPATNFLDTGAAGTTAPPHVFYAPGSTANFYSAYLHSANVSINGLAYGFAYDDQGGFSTNVDIKRTPLSATPQLVTITLPAWTDATQLAVTGPASATAGTQISITVTAENAASATVPGYAGTVHFTSSDPNAVLPADYTFQQSDNGTKTFMVTLKTSGTQTVTVTDASNGIKGVFSVPVSSGAADHLAFRTSAKISVAGTALPDVIVELQDALNNVVTGLTGTVALDLASSSSGAVLSGNKVANLINGVATFSGLTLSKLGVNTLSATFGSMTAPSDPFTTAPTTHFSISGPTSAKAGDNVSITVKALDAAGKVDPLYQGKVHFSSTDPLASLPTDYTFTAADGGQHTFTLVMGKAGSRTVTVSDARKSTIKGSKTLTVLAGAVTGFQVKGFPAFAFAGVKQNFTVTAVDIYGNTAPTYQGLVSLSSSDPAAVLSTTSALFTLASKGTRTLAATLKTTGVQSLTAVASTVAGTFTGSQTGINVFKVSASMSGPTKGVSGQDLSYTFGAVQGTASASAKFTYKITWGDGTAVQVVTGGANVTVTHNYKTTGTGRTIKVTVTDAAAHTSTATGTVDITQTLLAADLANSANTALFVGGTTGNDTIAIAAANLAGTDVSVTLNSTGLGTFTPTGNIYVFGGDGNDTITVQTGVAVKAFLFGGTGNDTLDTQGSIAANVLVGGAGNDILSSGAVASILSGGEGADKLQAGNGGAILSGGPTIYDSQAAALAALLDEWSSPGAYNTRVLNLMGLGVGLNGPFTLTPTTVKKNATATLVDSLLGGTGLDWFFLAGNTSFSNFVNGEEVTLLE